MGSGGYLLHAWDVEGTEAPGWPKFTGGWTLGSPSVGDINGDGYLDVVVTTREGFLFAWSSAGHADCKVHWRGVHHDSHNTGNYETPIPLQAGPVLEEGGCCKGKRAGAWLVLPTLMLGALRRRRGVKG